MEYGTTALIGLGAVGAPIAHKLYKAYSRQFALIATGERRKELESSELTINGEKFSPAIISDREEAGGSVSLIIVCVKNYDVKAAIEDIKAIVDSQTILLPLQNGIFSFQQFCRSFPENRVLRGYIQGPNTERTGSEIFYSQAGVMHIGPSDSATQRDVEQVYSLLEKASVDIRVEDDIEKMVWKKWMLNVAGNTVTALTGADYSQFKVFEDLPSLCRASMREFLQIAELEHIALDEADINQVIEYYTGYRGSKKTSMLEDVLNQRRTENAYISGELLRLAEKHGIHLPVNDTLYTLIKLKESIYLDRPQAVVSTAKNGWKLYSGAKIGDDCTFGKHGTIGEDSYINRSDLGDHVQINRRNLIENARIGAYTYTGMQTIVKHAEIGKFCSISWNCSIAGGWHDDQAISPHPFTRLKSFGIAGGNLGIQAKRITIGNDVWIGMNACILPGVTIGDGAVIGAGSVVTKDVSPYAVVAGNPAKLLRYRFDEETVNLLTESRWWDWPAEMITQYLPLFHGEFTRAKIAEMKALVASRKEMNNVE